MLNHLLAEIVALGSLVLFLSGFLLPEVQRKPDLAWSGVALLYALLLFAEGDRTSGGTLLGHIASAALILWFGWQTLQQRRACVAPESQTAIPGSLDALIPFLKEGWGRIRVTYGEASAWVQDQLGKGDGNTPVVKAPPASLQNVDDDEWEESGTSASPGMKSNVEPSESVRPEAPVKDEETEAIAAQKSTLSTLEVLVQNPLGIDTLAEAESSSSSGQESASTSTVPEPSYRFPEVQVEASVEPEASLDQDPPAALMATEHSTTETIEISHNTPEEEIIQESTAALEQEQHTSEEERNDESVHPTPESDDETWPPLPRD